jgi:Fungal specific transcription factor domain
MQDRIDKLEGLVLSLMTNGGETAGPAAASQALAMDSSGFQDSPSMVDESIQDEEEGSETDGVAKSLGVLHMTNQKSMYIGEGHWAAILKDVCYTLHEIPCLHANSLKIHEVKNFWNEHKKQYDDQIKRVEASRKQSGRVPSAVPVFMLGSKGRPLHDLMVNLPGKDVVDRLVGQYFNDYDPATHILHPPTWRIAYDNYWRNPGETDPAFLAQLFAICGLAMQSYHRSSEEPYEYKGRTKDMASNYRTLTKECLQLAEYVKPSILILETWILHLHSEYTHTGDADVSCWIFTGMIVHLAMRMGLHRDPKHYPNITPFQAEMRRRIWTFVRQADLLFSFQLGLPSSIKSGDTDTEFPRNLFDEDLEEHMSQLPNERPKSDWTQISYLIAKAQISFAFGKIVEATHSIVSAPYEEIVKLDEDLHSIYHSLPSVLHPKAKDDPNLEPVNILMMRSNISCLYNKALCVLHRKYLARAHNNLRYAQSRRACIDASMSLLRTQGMLHGESRPGQRMQHLRWHSSSLTMFDFLLAATLVCLDLFLTAQGDAVGQPSGDTELWGHSRRDEMMKALETSGGIWEELKDQYMEAFKAATICKVMLQKITAIRNQTTVRMAQRTYQYADGNSKPSQQYSPPEEEKPEHTAAITLGILSNGGLTPSSGSGTYSGGPYPPTPGSNANMPDAPGTGMTPGFSGDPFGVGAPDPLAFFGNGMSMDGPANLDWVSIEPRRLGACS